MKQLFLPISLPPMCLKRQENVLQNVCLEGFIGTMGGDYLQLTTKLWLPPQANTRHSPRQNDKKEMGVTVLRDSAFPLLDM
eukprot:13915806-Ditylum_brightwellii.AAC.1